MECVACVCQVFWFTVSIIVASFLFLCMCSQTCAGQSHRMWVIQTWTQALVSILYHIIQLVSRHGVTYLEFQYHSYIKIDLRSSRFMPFHFAVSPTQERSPSRFGRWCHAHPCLPAKSQGLSEIGPSKDGVWSVWEGQRRSKMAEVWLITPRYCYESRAYIK